MLKRHRKKGNNIASLRGKKDRLWTKPLLGENCYTEGVKRSHIRREVLSMGHSSCETDMGRYPVETGKSYKQSGYLIPKREEKVRHQKEVFDT